MSRVRLRVCPADELAPGVVRTCLVGRDRYGLPREALVLRDADGVLRGYVNQCKHLPIPIDAGSREFFDEVGEHLLCGTHGALFRLDDGMCVAGPCEGLPLDPVEVEENGGDVFVVADDV
ncbi:MAG: Rieske 2Fe-2S domain-containing protein [Myxococcales bacterium]|nr:Rieske 2Fe-2S domain-containing protein [Myxococcales bacterium]